MKHLLSSLQIHYSCLLINLFLLQVCCKQQLHHEAHSHLTRMIHILNDRLASIQLSLLLSISTCLAAGRFAIFQRPVCPGYLLLLSLPVYLSRCCLNGRNSSLHSGTPRCIDDGLFSRYILQRCSSRAFPRFPSGYEYFVNTTPS
jgi:hypothetical protein